MIRFKFWDPVYYWNWTDKAGKVLMHPGRFLGFAWNIDDPMTLKVIQCNKDLHNQNIVVHRGVVVPHPPTEIGYNFAMAPKSKAYSPDVQVKGGVTSKTSPLMHKGTLDPPDITIAEGGV